MREAQPSVLNASIAWMRRLRRAGPMTAGKVLDAPTIYFRISMPAPREKVKALINELFVALHQGHPAYFVERFGISTE